VKRRCTSYIDPEHRLSLAITVVQVLKGSRLTQQEIVRHLGSPTNTRGQSLDYSIARYYHQSDHQQLANTLRLTFSGDGLIDISLLSQKENGSYEEWNSYYLNTEK